MRTLCILSLLVFGGSMAPAASPAKPASERAQSNKSDAEIERDLRMRLNRGKIAADHFQATVKGGVATLTGHTDVIQHKGTATRLAKTAGARQVDNRIQISEAARRKAAANLEKHRRSGATQAGEEPVKRSEVTRRS